MGSCFALSVNEVNAALGRIVTAPTNGSAGVIPSVLMYYLVIETMRAKKLNNSFSRWRNRQYFQKGSTISAAMGGCQAEIGVPPPWLPRVRGTGRHPRTSFNGCRNCMEHHLGLTCDPIGGLVQIPCRTQWVL
jgi:L-serine dehydratase